MKNLSFQKQVAVGFLRFVVGLRHFHFQLYFEVFEIQYIVMVLVCFLWDVVFLSFRSFLSSHYFVFVVVP